MGIYTDLSTTVGGPVPRSGNARAAAQQLLNKATVFDATISANLASQDEVTQIAQHVATVSGGTFALTVTIEKLDITYTTAVIVWNAADTVIQTALDVASPAGVGDGDIAVLEEASAGLSDGFCDFTCSGDLAATPVVITIDGALLTGGGTEGAVTRTTPGQTDRQATQALFDLNVVAGTVPVSGIAPSDWTRPATVGQTRPRSYLLVRLARVASDEEGTEDVYTTVRDLYPEIELF